MLRAWRRLVLLAVLAFLVSGPAHAYRFGTDDSIHKIQDVTLKGPKDEKLFLGYMTRIKWFLAGLYVEDAGYVLGVEGDSKRYFHMPTGDELAGFQRNGFLPNPLPPYSLSWFDYVMGYSLWWGLAIGGLAVWWGDRKKKTAAAQAAGTPPGAPSGEPVPHAPNPSPLPAAAATPLPSAAHPSVPVAPAVSQAGPPAAPSRGDR